MKIKLFNNINILLQKKGISIRKMAIELKMDYKTAHNLANREDLSTTQLGTLKKVADYLEVSIEEMYEEKDI